MSLTLLNKDFPKKLHLPERGGMAQVVRLHTDQGVRGFGEWGEGEGTDQGPREAGQPPSLSAYWQCDLGCFLYFSELLFPHL